MKKRDKKQKGYKMKTITKIIALVTIMTSGITTISASDMSGKQLLTANCISCHATQHVADESTMLAPPIMGVIRHVKEKYPNKEDAVAFMIDYIQNPSADKAVCESKAIERFGLMPSLKGAVSSEELEKIANYAYNTYPNGNGKGRGRGKGHGKGHGKGQKGGQGDSMHSADQNKAGQGRGQGRGKQGKGKMSKGKGKGKGGQGQGRYNGNKGQNRQNNR